MAITCCWIRLQQGELGLYLAHPIGKLRGCPDHFNPTAHAPPERREACQEALALGGRPAGMPDWPLREAGACQHLGDWIFRAFRTSASLAIVSSSCRMSSAPGAKSAIPGWMSGDPIQAALRPRETPGVLLVMGPASSRVTSPAFSTVMSLPILFRSCARVPP